MYPKSIQTLIEIFAKFPGIGPRQAARFVFYLIREKNELIPLMMKSLDEVNKKVEICQECFRTTEANGKNSVLCSFCVNPKRNAGIILVVEKESDMQNIEKTGAFDGRYHLLGGTISPLDHESPRKLHLKELHGRIQKILQEKESAEVILATSTTTEGDMTAVYIERILEPLKKQFPKFALSRLGRGLSSGAELEYADEATLKNALTNRK